MSDHHFESANPRKQDHNPMADLSHQLWAEFDKDVKQAKKIYDKDAAPIVNNVGAFAKEHPVAVVIGGTAAVLAASGAIGFAGGCAVLGGLELTIEYGMSEVNKLNKQFK